MGIQLGSSWGSLVKDSVFGCPSNRLAGSWGAGRRWRAPPCPLSAVAVAGTATTFAALALGLTTYDGGRVHGSTLSVGGLRTWMHKLLEVGPEARKALFGVSPDRAYTLLEGAVVLLRVLKTTRRQAWQVSDCGLRRALVQG